MMRKLIGLIVMCSMSCLGQTKATAAVNLKVVKGAPFSAEAVTESTQVLADGNHIVRKSSAAIARDSEGRTRREQRIAGINASPRDAASASVVFIQDPVSDESYVLDPGTRLARRIHTPKAGSTQGADIATEIASTSIATVPLGAQLIEGVLAEGTRMVRTIPVGQVGNERALEVVTESWYCAELDTIVMSTTTDPRLGETRYKLTEIKRGEPVRTLFEIPAGYTQKEEPNGTGNPPKY